FHRLLRSVECHLRNAVSASRFTPSQQGVGVKILDLATEFVFQMRSIEAGDITDARLSGGGVAPCFFYIISCWADNPHTRDNYSPSLHSLLRRRLVQERNIA